MLDEDEKKHLEKEEGNIELREQSNNTSSPPTSAIMVEYENNCYMNGNVSKEDFAAALRAHQAAVDATKSPQREAAKDNA